MSEAAETEKNSSTRRTFIQASTATIAGAGAASSAYPRPAVEPLALDGGPKAVTIPAAQHARITKWPRYGAEEKRAVLDLLENNKFYQEIPRLEKELTDHLDVPYAKAHSNGTSALMSMFFALDLPRGSEIMAPSYTAWATTAPMHLFG
ncbi:MAG: DegT/DnrJ/EryC1/StrS aminotransferase family protein, partial [bacterium]|nr:DegT/DnrJ/EryC1/StrS aminotransferase family protein [bacterium]